MAMDRPLKTVIGVKLVFSTAWAVNYLERSRKSPAQKAAQSSSAQEQKRHRLEQVVQQQDKRQRSNADAGRE
ncbi:hypothetical protein QC762_0116130 [Podospora pseudocomata]|uniref:Uncharacterized protein n=1 Tax=Podospora pseudocomata TaxID=2093779 RepID=A0ABR0G5T5_9PEZI|nr:hypothetical protein QC762_0116130 [Podospora pseudocomata]